MVLWDEEPTIEQNTKGTETTKSSIKLKKGETIDTLIIAARKIVEEKLGKYKETSLCVIDPEDLIEFFNETPDNGLMALDTETTRFKYIYRYSCWDICM